MNYSNRDLKKPISYCCGQMEQELARGDILHYTWFTRDFSLRSSTTPQVFSLVEFCPWCGKYLAGYSVYDEYWEAHEKAEKEDPTLPDILRDSELAEFRENFLRNWEAQNQTFETKRYNNYNQEKLKELLENAKSDGFVVPKAPTLNSVQTEKIVDAIIDETGLESTEQALILLAIIFQKGGTTGLCDKTLEAEVQGKKLRLKTVRNCMRNVGLPRMERRLARSLATPIYKVCASLNIPGNLARAILNNEAAILTNVTDADKAWMSDFQSDNQDCPEAIRRLISNHLKNKKQPQNRNQKS